MAELTKNFLVCSALLSFIGMTNAGGIAVGRWNINGKRSTLVLFGSFFHPSHFCRLWGMLKAIIHANNLEWIPKMHFSITIMR
jgi:hypothetical protein